MPSSFQPEKPHAADRRSTSWVSVLVLALGAALVVVMLLALGAPRLFGDDGVSWLVTLLVGVLTFAAVLGFGLTRRSRRGTSASGDAAAGR